MSVSPDLERCPHCGYDLHTMINGKEYSRAIGCEIRGLHDGILFWQCPKCSKTWHRFPPDTRLYNLADPFVTKVRT